MADIVAKAVLMAAAAYLAVGVPFSVAFVRAGIERVDPAAHGSPLTFRLIILPGVAALWPVLWVKWRRAASGQGEPQ